MSTLIAHLNNDEVSAQFADREKGRAAFVAVMSWQTKQGRKWETAQAVYVDRAAAEQHAEWLQRIYREDVRNFNISVHLLHG
jgi:hypothetical protein